MNYELIEISTQHEKAFLEMIADYEEKDRETLAKLYPGKWSALIFRNYVKTCEKARQDWRPKAGQVSETRYVLVDEEGELCANGVMRFPLDNEIGATGGNLIFDVPPSKRREGFGALVLNRMLFEAVRAGLARVLVTCEKENVGAIKAIEKNRGIFECEAKGLQRFWISLR